MNKAGTQTAETKGPLLQIDLQDTEWPYEYTDHDRMIARAICFDEEGFFYFVRAQRDDEFGKATLIETSGGGVEESEDLQTAVRRELKEELGVEAEVLCELGVVSDYYNLIHRHNLNHYFLCKVICVGEKDLTQDEIERFHLSTLKLTYEEAVREYEARRATSLGKLVANRELPVLRKAREMMDREDAMIKVLFVCHGNICRSPMAQYIFEDLARKEGISPWVEVDSAATSMEEIGNPVYPPARRKLREKGIPVGDHRARRMERRDYREYDYLIGMEQFNIRNMMRILGEDPEGKVCRLLDFSDRPRDIDDPWYTGDFETAYREILEGCQALLAHIRRHDSQPM